MNNSSEKEKSVSFHLIAQVILIPHASEYHQAQLSDSLWWSNDEMNNFRTESDKEIAYYFSLNKGRNLTLKQALNEIYAVNLRTVEPDYKPLEQMRLDATTPELKYDNSGYSFFKNDSSSAKKNEIVPKEELDEPSSCIIF